MKHHQCLTNTHKNRSSILLAVERFSPSKTLKFVLFKNTPSRRFLHFTEKHSSFFVLNSLWQLMKNLQCLWAAVEYRFLAGIPFAEMLTYQPRSFFSFSKAMTRREGISAVIVCTTTDCLSIVFWLHRNPVKKNNLSIITLQI